MHAQELLRDGDLAGAVAALQDAVRKDPGNVKLRVFLFQLMAVLGQWNRALTQLNVAAELDAATVPMVQTYREALRCEVLRADIFAGKRSPVIFGEPTPWLAQLAEALKIEASQPERAAAARAAAFEAAPASPGSIDGQRFEWLADADPRLGPVLEAVVNGRYFWIPLFRIRRIEFDAPADLRDKVWTAATFTWTNGSQTVGLVPTRYDGTVASGDPALLLAHSTEWNGNGRGHGLGQRMLVSDSADYALMDVRIVEFDAGGEAANGANGAGHG